MNDNNFNWDAISYFRQLVDGNKLAVQNGFRFCVVSDLEGFEEALQNMQSSTAFCCVSDVSPGTIRLDNAPSTRRIKTVFLAMRHPIDDMNARMRCFDILREIFRQFMSALIRERTRLVDNRIYLHQAVEFTEIDQFFFSGCAAAYFQIAVDTPTSLIYNDNEWTDI